MELSIMTTIARAPERVFAWITLPERIEQLIGVDALAAADDPAAMRATCTLSGPLDIGTRLTYRYELPPQIPTGMAPRETIVEVTAYAPPRTFAVQSLSDPIAMTLRFDLDPEVSGTYLTITWRMAPTGAVGALAARIGLLVARGRLEDLLAQIKTAIEQD